MEELIELTKKYNRILIGTDTISEDVTNYLLIEIMKNHPDVETFDYVLNNYSHGDNIRMYDYISKYEFIIRKQLVSNGHGSYCYGGGSNYIFMKSDLVIFIRNKYADIINNRYGESLKTFNLSSFDLTSYHRSIKSHIILKRLTEKMKLFYD